MVLDILVVTHIKSLFLKRFFSQDDKYLTHHNFPSLNPGQTAIIESHTIVLYTVSWADTTNQSEFAAEMLKLTTTPSLNQVGH